MSPRKKVSAHAERGFAMVLVLGIVALLLMAGLAMLVTSDGVALATQNNEQKNLSFDAAEAGLNVALEALDNNPATSASGSGTLSSGGSYSYSIINNLAGSFPMPSTDPVTQQPIQIPAARAFVYSTGTGATGLRSVTTEAIVKQFEVTYTFPNYAILAELDIAGNWNPPTGIAESSPGLFDANMHANQNITGHVGFVQGVATATGNTNTFNSDPTAVGTAHIDLPTNQLGSYIAAQKQIALAGGPYALYVPNGGSLPSFDCPAGAPPQGCVVFVDGPVHMSGGSDSDFTGRVNVVINGNYTATGNAGAVFQSGTQSVLAVNGATDIGGNGSVAALIWSKGNTTLHGNGTLFGALVCGGTVYLKGGGSSGGFKYDSSLQGLAVQTPGRIVVITYGEF